MPTFLHEIPDIALGLDALAGMHSRFGDADRSQFPWQRRDADFGGLTRMILGQQVSTYAAAAMEAKLDQLMPLSDPAFFLSLTDDQLRWAGFSRQKIRYARALADTLVADPYFLTRLLELDDEAVVATLTSLPGIGRWSAEVYLMFCLGRPDVWPAGDLGIVLGMQYLLDMPEKPKPAEMVALAENWRPYRSAAALLVWNHYTRVAAERRREQRQAAKGSVR